MASRMSNRAQRAARRALPPDAETTEEAPETLSDDDTSPDEDDDETSLAPAPARDLTATDVERVARRTFEDYLPGWVPAYLRNAIIELRKVVWPSRQEAVNLTLIVVAMAIVFAVVFGLIDIGFYNILQSIIKSAG